MPKGGVEIKGVADIVAYEDDEPEHYIMLAGVEVAAALSLDTYLACLVCKSKVASTTKEQGRCRVQCSSSTETLQVTVEC